MLKQILELIIAKPVNNPKYIVGIKFDKARIENPKTIVTKYLI